MWTADAINTINIFREFVQWFDHKCFITWAELSCAGKPLMEKANFEVFAYKCP